MENTTSILVGLVSALVGAFITGSYLSVIDWWRRPRLVVDYEGVDGRNKVETAHLEAGKQFSGVYIRVRLRNVGRRRPAKNCLVFLTGIEEVHPSGTTVAPFHDASPVSWAGWGFSPRDVPKGVDFYCDVFRVSKDDPGGWLVSVEKILSSQAKIKDYRGTYRFKLLATADNAEPFSYTIDATYDGDWHNLRVIGK